MLLSWKLKPIPFIHHLEISKGAANCIKNSISEDQRKIFDELKKEYKIENAVGAIGDDNSFVPIIEQDIPSDITEILFGCYCGVYQKYCEEKGL